MLSKRLFNLTLMGMLCLILAGASVQEVAVAQAEGNARRVSIPRQHSAQLLYTRGRIESVEGERVLVRTADGRELCALVNPSIYIIEGESGRLRLPRALAVGQEVVLYHSAHMTRSLPPQTVAHAFVLGAEGEYLPQYVEAEQVEKLDEQSVRVLSRNRDLLITVPQEACAEQARITEGARLLVWSRMMTMSMPGLMRAERAVLLP